MYLYIVISNKRASEHNIRPNKKVYTELCYYMENGNHFRWPTYVATHRLHSLYLCTKYETWKLKTLGVRVPLQNSCSPPSLIFPHPQPRSFLPPLIHPKPTSFKSPAFLPESPCSVHLIHPHVTHPIPLPSTDILIFLLPTVLCFPLPLIVSCSLCYTFYVFAPKRASTKEPII